MPEPHFVEIGAHLGPLLGGLRRAEAMVGRFGGSVRAAGMAMAKLAFAMALPLKLVSDEFGEFEQAMARVNASSDDLSVSQFGALTAKAREMGLVTQSSATDAARAMASFAKAGWGSNQIMKAIRPTVQLAAASFDEITGQQISAAQAADFTIKAMSGLGLSVEQLPELLDVMAKAARTANTELPQLSEALNKVGSISDFMGVQAYEVIAALQLMSDRGMQAEEAGTNLRSILVALVSPSREAAAMLQRLNVDIGDANGNFRGLANIIGDLEKGMEGLGTQERGTAMATIFHQRQANAAANLFMAGSAKLRKYTDSLRNSRGELERIARIQLDTWKGAVKLVTSSIQGLGIAIGQALQPVLRPLARTVMEVINSLSSWVDASSETARSLLIWTAALGAAGVALTAFGVSVQVVSFGLGGLATAIGFLKGATMLLLTPAVGLTAAGAALGYTLGGMSAAAGGAAVSLAALAGVLVLAKAVSLAYSVAMGVATAATVAFNLVAAVTASPLLVLAATAGIVAAVMAATTATALQAFRGLGQGLSQIGSGIVATLTSVVANARDSIAAIREAIEMGDLEGAFKIALLGVQAAWEELWGNLKAGAMNQLSLIGAGAVKTFLDLVASAQTAWVAITEFIGSAWDVLLTKLMQGWNELVGYAKKAWVEVTTLSTSAAAEKRAAIDAETDKKNAELEAGMEASVNDRGEAAKRARKRIGANIGGLKDQIDQDVEREIRERNKAAASAGAGTRAERDLLLWERQQRLMGPKPLTEAEEMARWVEMQKSMGPKLPDGLQKELPTTGGAMAGKSAEASATFNAAVASMLGGRSVTDQIRDNTRQAVDELQKLNNKIVPGIPVV